MEGLFLSFKQMSVKVFNVLEKNAIGYFRT